MNIFAIWYLRTEMYLFDLNIIEYTSIAISYGTHEFIVLMTKQYKS